MIKKVIESEIKMYVTGIKTLFEYAVETASHTDFKVDLQRKYAPGIAVCPGSGKQMLMTPSWKLFSPPQ